MKSKAAFVTNFDEIEKCDSMGIEWKPETANYPFLFNLEDVKAAYIDIEGDIIVYLEIIQEDSQWRLKYDKELWTKLEQKFQ